ncbi:hypothetical protein [Rhodoferax sp.]|uniref:hypothetical protein n=1 Tax=Rhodoferax sp. TaxID=50421 RepID=UPI0025D8F7DE|nr:hypothetical protein [Rhodoferax sp.]
MLTSVQWFRQPVPVWCSTKSAENLMAIINGGALRPYNPKRRSLYLLSCGPRYAAAFWGQWSAQGQWVWRWKDWIDRGFVRRFSENPPKLAAHLMEDTT